MRSGSLCRHAATGLGLWLVSATATYAQTVATAYLLDRDRSSIYVVTARSGLLSFLGHEHAILAHEWEGAVCADEEPVPRGHGRIVVRTGSLEIDSDSARSLAGLGRGPGADQRRKLQQTLLDAAHLAADSSPTLTMEVTEIVPADGGATAHARLTLRDQTRAVAFPIALARAGDELRIEGVLHVAQSDFGIRPESIAGVVRVVDRVAIYFNLLAIDTRVSCR